MQRNIYNFALQGGEINRNILCEMCDQMEETMRKRFVEAILGVVDVEEIVKSVPVTSKDVNGNIRTLRGYNYFYDRLDYAYTQERTRYFKDEDKALQYAATGEFSFGNSSYQEAETYPYAATHSFEFRSDCTLAEWLRGSEE